MINNIILDWINILKDKPKMIIPEPDISYKILRIYIEGFINGIEISLNIGLRKDITKWYNKKINIQTSHLWTSHIPLHFHGETEDALKVILLDFTEDYFRENPDWFIGNN